MKKKFAKLIDVKSIITLIMTATLCTLVLRQNTEVSPETLVTILSAVFTYLFAKNKSENSNSNNGDE